MSNPNKPVDEYVYQQMREVFRRGIHSVTCVNETDMAASAHEAHNVYIKAVGSFGYDPERFKVVSAVALRDTWRDRVALDNPQWGIHG